jgi:hypothetical protein
MSPREQVAWTINGSLQRLPLVLEILEEIQETKEPGFPGDEDLRHGSIRAVHTMVERLDRIAPAPVVLSDPISTAEEIACEWLLGDRPRRLIPEPLLERLTELISRLLPLDAHSMNRTGESS